MTTLLPTCNTRRDAADGGTVRMPNRADGVDGGPLVDAHPRGMVGRYRCLASDPAASFGGADRSGRAGGREGIRAPRETRSIATVRS